MKILMDMHDKLTKERDQLKKQNDQLVKQNEQLKKKRKGSTDKLLASPNPPPDEDSTLLEIEFAQQRADDADKRADVATAKAMEAERRAKEAEKQAKAAGLKHVGAETRALTMEKELDDKYVQAQVSYIALLCKRQYCIYVFAEIEAGSKKAQVLLKARM